MKFIVEIPDHPDLTSNAVAQHIHDEIIAARGGLHPEDELRGIKQCNVTPFNPPQGLLVDYTSNATPKYHLSYKPVTEGKIRLKYILRNHLHLLDDAKKQLEETGKVSFCGLTFLEVIKL
jgi:hypothetical protein